LRNWGEAENGTVLWDRQDTAREAQTMKRKTRAIGLALVGAIVVAVAAQAAETIIAG